MLAMVPGLFWVSVMASFSNNSLLVSLAMNIKILLFLCSSAFIFFQSLAVRAQQVPVQSDTTGAIITTSDVSGGSFAPGLAGGGTKFVFVRAGAQTAVNRAATTVVDQLRAGNITATTPSTALLPGTQQSVISTLTGVGLGQPNVFTGQVASTLTEFDGIQLVAPANILNPVVNASNLRVTVNTAVDNALNPTSTNGVASLTGTTLPATAQQTVLGAMTSGGSAGVDRVVSVLSSSQGAPTGNQIQQLGSSLKGLLASGRVSPNKLIAAVNAYNAVIDSSSPQFLTSPPPELLTIQSVLSRLVNSAFAAR